MAKLLEFQSKRLLQEAGIAVPNGEIIEAANEVGSAGQRLGYPVALKAQVPAGKRGKAGGILFSASEVEAVANADTLLSRTVHGYRVERLLVEQQVEILHEHYLAIFSNPQTRAPVLIYSRSGGMDVEEVAAAGGSGTATADIDPLEGLHLHTALEALREAGVSGRGLPALARVAVQLYGVYWKYDCTLAEINPLAATKKGPVAVDARLSIDDDAVARHPELGLEAAEEVGDRPPTEFERIAAKIDENDHRGSAHFVQIDPFGELAAAEGMTSIGFDGIGTGVSLTAMDELVAKGFLPKNFCDTSGNPTASKLYRATRVILSQPDIEGYVFASCLSSQQLDNTARGIVKAFLELFPEGQPHIPCVLSFRGAWDETALEMFEIHGIAAGRWVRLLGRDSTEQDLALAFSELHAEWSEHRNAEAAR